MIRRLWTPLWIAIAISAPFFHQLPECKAQSTLAGAEYDYHALALTAIADSAREASKLTDITQRVGILLYAAKILAPFQKNEATRLLDIALIDLKQLSSDDKTSIYEQHALSRLRDDVLALYAQVNPAKAEVLQKEFQNPEQSRNSEISLRSKSWSVQFSDQSRLADQRAKIALSLLDTDPDKTLALVVQSLQGGSISTVLLEIVDRLIQNGNRVFLNRLEINISQSLPANGTLDPHSVSCAALLVLADKEMPLAARTSFISFLMRSLQAWATVVREPGTDASYTTRGFFAFSQTVRLVISQYAPDQLVFFNSVLNQAADLVPERMKSVTQVIQPEALTDPRERLNDILKDPFKEKRDARLIRLVSQLLPKEPAESHEGFDLITEAVNSLSDIEAKSAFTDLLTISRLNSFAKQKKFLDAQKLSGSISSVGTRAWALLALARVASKADPVLGFDMIANALKVVDQMPSSPQKVELGLMAAAMLTESDEQRAFEILSTVVKYANTSPAKIDSPSKPVYAFGLNASLGAATTRLGVFPQTLADLKIDPALSALAKTDWFRADQIVNDIREPGLRLRLRLHLANAVLLYEAKRNKKQAAR